MLKNSVLQFWGRMNSKEYWEKRQRIREEAGDKTVDELLKSTKKLYDDFNAAIDKEVLAFYSRFSIKSDVSISEVKKLLDPKELQSYRKELKRYYDKINDLKVNNKLTADVLTKYKKELDTLSAKSYMSRLETLKNNLKYNVVKMAAKQSYDFQEKIEKMIPDVYNRTNYDIAVYKGYTYDLAGLPDDKLEHLLNEKWLGDNYSSLIWKNKQDLLDKLDSTFMTGVARGFNPNKIAEEMVLNSNTDLYNYQRLCRTEVMHFLNESTFESYKHNNVHKYEIVVGLDERTCELCGDLDGKTYDMSEKVEGVTYPPFHPNCRCTTVPSIPEDDIDRLTDEVFGKDVRIAYDEDRKSYYVPIDLTYKEWKEQQEKYNAGA